jgi:hypothetical protein
MLEELETYIKLAVDVERNILAGGGEYHADCEEVLLENGSRQEDIWVLTGILTPKQWNLLHSSTFALAKTTVGWKL